MDTRTFHGLTITVHKHPIGEMESNNSGNTFVLVL